MGLSTISEPCSATAVQAPQPGDVRAVDHILRFAEKYRKWFFLFLVALYVSGFNGLWRIEPDGALYLTLARNIDGGRGYVYHGRLHHLAYPGLPYLIAGTFDAFGRGNLLPIHLLITGMSLLTLALVYRLLLVHVDRATAVVVTFITGGSYLFLSFAYQLRNDMPYALGVIAFFCGLEGWRKRPSRRGFDGVLMACGISLAIVMRPAMWALLFAIAVAAAIHLIRYHRRVFVLLAFIGAGVASIWILRMDNDALGRQRILGDYEEQSVSEITGDLNTTLWRVIGVNFPHLLGPILAESICGHELGPVTNTLAGVGILLSAGVFLRSRPIWLIFIVANLLMMLLVLPREAILPRYILPIFPLLVLAVWRGVVWLNHALPRPWDWIGVIILCAWLIPNGIKDGEIIREQHAADFYAVYKNGRFVPIMDMANSIRAIVPKSAYTLVESKTGRILTYFSGRRAVDSWEVPRLKTGREIYVIQPGDEPLRDFLREKNIEVRQPPLASHGKPEAAGPITLHSAVVGGKSERP